MNKKIVKQFSIVGLLLFISSFVVAAIRLKPVKNMRVSGALQASICGGRMEQTCKAGSANECDYTKTDNINSFTTEPDGDCTSDPGLSTPAIDNTGLLTHNGDGFHVTK